MDFLNIIEQNFKSYRFSLALDIICVSSCAKNILAKSIEIVQPVQVPFVNSTQDHFAENMNFIVGCQIAGQFFLVSEQQYFDYI